MKKLLLSAILISSTFAFAQIGTSTQIGGENSKWTFGGGASLGLSGGGSGVGTTIGISPRVGYLVTDNLELGLASGFTWGNSKYYSSTMIGVGPFANYYISRNFFVSGLFQQYFINQKDKLNNFKYSGDEAALYLGGGYLQKIGDRLYMQIGASYNVLYDEKKSVFGGGFAPNFGIVYGL